MGLLMECPVRLNCRTRIDVSVSKGYSWMRVMAKNSPEQVNEDEMKVLEEL
jgi:hypothetical protein